MNYLRNDNGKYNKIKDYTSEYSYPFHWDQLLTIKHILAKYDIPSKLTYKNCQPKYW